ncbi:MAG: hypothetical protein L3J93_06705, partial [Thermoplasmata archaeon]|nr:hypothetical protein [Thermoplasmata archaeon]
GTYTITASLSGYASVTMSFDANSASAPLVVALKPNLQTNEHPGASMTANLEYAAALVLAGAAVGVVLFTVTRRRPRRAAGKPPATR